MGHAHHFLERLERLSPAHTDRALALYRDPELLEFLLSRIRLPEGSGRVALALEDREDAPHIIVTRDGGFVTCLGAGMSVGDLPVVSRHATDRVAEKLDGARAILDSGEGESKRLYQRFFLANAGLSREDFGALAALMPIQAMTFISVAADMNGHVVPAHYRIQSKNRARLTPEFQQEIRAYWELTWLISALVMLISERRDDVEALSLKGHEPASAAVQAMALSCMIVGFDTPILLRASRAIASMGPPLLGFAHERLLGATDMRQMAVAGTALCAIGLRYPRKAEEVLKLLREYRERPLSEEKHALEGIRMFIDRLIEHFDPKKRMAAEERIRKLGVSRLMEHFASQPGAAPRFERPEDVPEDLAVAAALRFSGDLLMTPESLETGALLAPWAAHSDPSLLLLPAQLQSHIPPAFDPLFVAVRAQITRDRREPVRSEKTPGRNDPCSCGSGKKYKRCCGISV